MLSNQEQKEVYEIYAMIFGEDISVKRYQRQFNEKTVYALEKAIVEISQCNSSLKELTIDIASCFSLVTRVLLKKALKYVHRSLKFNIVKVNWVGCRNTAKSPLRMAIIASAI